jgi:hypothetical protein
MQQAWVPQEPHRPPNTLGYGVLVQILPEKVVVALVTPSKRVKILQAGLAHPLRNDALGVDTKELEVVPDPVCAWPLEKRVHVHYVPVVVHVVQIVVFDSDVTLALD